MLADIIHWSGRNRFLVLLATAFITGNRLVPTTMKAMPARTALRTVPVSLLG